LKDKEVVRGETDEIKARTSGVFTALRDEVEEQIHAINKQPRLTEAEQGALRRLKEALDISEELVDKEIDDVKKALKKD